MVVPLIDNRKKVLLFQSSLFLKAFKRRLNGGKELSVKTFTILDRVEEIAGGCLTKKESLIKDRELQLLFDALNDLVEAINFREEFLTPKKLRHFAFKDQLTGLYNRHYLKEVLKRVEKNLPFPVGIVIVDMDNLKEINDSRGHSIGDLYLKELSEVIKSSVRQSDLVFRIGGDEFLIVIKNASQEALKKILNRLRKGLDRINREKKLKPKLEASIGASIWEGPQEPFQRAFERADAEMYKEKLNGKP
ncbi:GGDEF domain-containing protein [Thermovibrio sp.]